MKTTNEPEVQPETTTQAASTSSKPEEPPAVPVASEPVTSSGCSDNVLFVDEFGQPCQKWAGLNCSKAAEEFGFTQDAEDDVIEMCPWSCGLCDQPEDDTIHVKITAVLTPTGTPRSVNSLAQKRQREAGKRCDCATR